MPALADIDICGDANRILRAAGHPQRLRLELFELGLNDEGNYAIEVVARWVDAPEVERRIGERYMQHDGD